MTKILSILHTLACGMPGVLLILGIGVFLTVSTGFVQVTRLPEALRCFWSQLRRKEDTHGVSPFRALCTALAATVGTGNLVGVAGAICIGGPGAVFWMWVCAFFGMAVKYAEAALSVRFQVCSDGERLGGTMYLIVRGMGQKWKPLAKAYCIFGMFACFGIGTTAQANAVVTGIHSILVQHGAAWSGMQKAFFGMLLAFAVGLVLLGGSRRIGQIAELLVPAAAVSYILFCLFALLCRRSCLPDAFASIFRGAFSPKAVTGGAVGSVFTTVQTGCIRGVFTNEAGLGTAAMAHGTSETEHPAQQGLLGIVEVFLDTVVICTLTALVILCSGVPIPYGRDAGGLLTSAAFSAVFGDWISFFLTGFLGLFAFATILGWGLYGSRCACFLFGQGAQKPFACLQTAAVVLGAVFQTDRIWQFSEILNGLMAVPNMLALAMLSPELSRLSKEFRVGIPATGGTYANIHQRKPL